MFDTAGGAPAEERQTVTPSAPNRRNRLAWIIGLSSFALLFGGTALRIVPGGPFISLHSDVLPTLAALSAIRLGLLTLRGKDTAAKLVSLVFILVATIAISNVFNSVYLFWHRPYARGDFLGL